LVPKNILKQLYKDNRISINYTKSIQLVDLLQKNYEKDNEQLLQLVSQFTTNFSDLDQLAHVLVKYSDAGKKYGWKLFKLSSLLGSVEGEFQYAHMLSLGFPGKERNQKEAMNIISRLARKNHPKSNHILALDAIKRKSFTEAVRYLNIASDGDFGLSQSILGTWTSKGQFVKKNAERGRELLQKAHEKSIPEASANLSEFFLRDNPSNREKALELLLISATAGIPIAQHNLASLYLDTDDIPPQNVGFAIEYWKMAAEQNYIPSQFMLAQLSFNGFRTDKEEIPKDMNMARYFFEKVVHSSDTSTEMQQFVKDTNNLYKKTKEFHHVIKEKILDSFLWRISNKSSMVWFLNCIVSNKSKGVACSFFLGPNADASDSITIWASCTYLHNSAVL
jgi:TPR repeat protein